MLDWRRTAPACHLLPRQATCRHPQVKGMTMMVNSIYNGFRFEGLWLDN
jgi:hypothetical protein